MPHSYDEPTAREIFCWTMKGITKMPSHRQEAYTVLIRHLSAAAEELKALCLAAAADEKGRQD